MYLSAGRYVAAVEGVRRVVAEMQLEVPHGVVVDVDHRLITLYARVGRRLGEADEVAAAQIAQPRSEFTDAFRVESSVDQEVERIAGTVDRSRPGFSRMPRDSSCPMTPCRYAQWFRTRW